MRIAKTIGLGLSTAAIAGFGVMGVFPLAAAPIMVPSIEQAHAVTAISNDDVDVPLNVASAAKKYGYGDACKLKGTVTPGARVIAEVFESSDSGDTPTDQLFHTFKGRLETQADASTGAYSLTIPVKYTLVNYVVRVLVEVPATADDEGMLGKPYVCDKLAYFVSKTTGKYSAKYNSTQVKWKFTLKKLHKGDVFTFKYKGKTYTKKIKKKASKLVYKVTTKRGHGKKYRMKLVTKYKQTLLDQSGTL